MERRAAQRARFRIALATWLHKVRVAGARWRSALILSLPTPVLAALLPLVALASASWWETLVA
jgi:hypothetical protein